MAKTKEVKNRIRSVGNTRKITHTMELVATARSKVAQGRLRGVLAFHEGVRAAVKEALRDAPDFRHPVLGEPGESKRTALVLVTANRGLCGGFNSNLIRMAGEFIRREKAAGGEVDLFAVGKKGALFFQRHGHPPVESFNEFDGPAQRSAVVRLGDLLLAGFQARRFGKVWTISTRYHSAGSQRPGEQTLLPLSVGREERFGPRQIYEPGAVEFLAAALPLLFQAEIFRAVFESITSEHIARRVAMKNASDAAEDMIHSLTISYNRARQAQITQEISEIVGGAAAVE